MLRTHTCGDLRAKEISKEATLCGWVNARRDHGGIIFIDLRDRYGLTQLVFDPNFNKTSHSEAEKLRREDVLQAKGVVKERREGMKNPNLPTGDVEVFISGLTILNKAQVPPLEIEDRIEASEEMRLKYRYLDLRRPKVQQQLLFRHRVVTALREYLNNQEFAEIETPLLLKHTPEGARDYIVPSRVHPGRIYSLPQSPQIYKQILMISGFDRYYQIARCLRDEDLRADRQPEHTQLDIEMSFVGVEDIFSLTEGLMSHIFKKILNKGLTKPFPQLTYDEAMEKYGIDKPDIRFGLELINVTDVVKNSDFQVFVNTVRKGGIVKCINAAGAGLTFSRAQVDGLVAFAQENGAKGLAWIKVMKEGLEGTPVKFISEKIQKELLKKTGAKAGDLLLFVADENKTVVNSALAKLRLKLGTDLGLINKEEFAFCFVTEFPMFEWNAEENKWDAMHNPFTLPKKEHWEFIEKDPSKVYSDQYDLVLNGTELFSGSIRNYIPELQERVFKAIGIGKEKAQAKFGFLLEAYRYGAPIHAGFGLGIDRLVAMMQGLSDIREVIAFPKTKSAENPMDGSPSPIEEKHLKELHLMLDDVAKKNIRGQ